MNVAQVHYLLCRAGLVDRIRDVAVAVSVLRGLQVEVADRHVVLLQKDLVIFAEVLVLIGGAGKEAGIAIVCSVGGQRDVSAHDVGRCGVQQTGGYAIRFSSCAVGGTVGSIHLHLRSLVRARHVNLKSVRRKVARAFGGRGYDRASELLSDDLPQATKAEEEEGFVALHRAPDDTAKLVAVVRRIKGRIPGDGVEVCVPVELEQGAMDLVGS